MHSSPTYLEIRLRRRAYEHFNITLNMFNDNLGLCLPVRDFREVENPASLDERISQDHEMKA